MPVSEAQKRAIEKYAQSEKGRAALQRAHQKRADTEEYREYQRLKQAEYRRKKKGQAALGKVNQSSLSQGQETPLPIAERDFSKLDKLIKRFEDDLLNRLHQQGLSYETLPSNFQAVLDALEIWKAGQGDA